MREFRELKSVSDVLSLIADYDGDLESYEVIESVAQLMYVNDVRLAQGAALFLVSSCGADGRMSLKRHLAIKDPACGKDIRGVLELLGHHVDHSRFKVVHGGKDPVPGTEEARKQYCTCPGKIDDTDGYTVDRFCVHHGDR